MSKEESGKPALTGLEALALTTSVRAELIRAVVQARRNLSDQQEIARETVARFKRRVARAEADATAAGIDLAAVPE